MKIATCESVREYLLAAGWDADARRQAAEVLHHAEGCDECRAALEDFDRIRTTLTGREPAEPAGGWEAMHGRIGKLLKLRGSMGLTAGAAAESGTGGSMRIGAARPPVVRPSLAIAAALMAVAAATFQIGRYFTPLPTEPTTTAVPVFLVDPKRAEPAPERISPQDVSQEVEAFRKVADVYDGRAAWMMLSNSSSDSDVGMIASSTAPSNKLLLLRLGLWHGRNLESNTDLLVRAGQTADVKVALSTGQSLHYRIGTSAGTGADESGANNTANLYLWLDLKTAAGNPLAALVTNLLIHPDQAVTAGTLATAEGEFELKIEFKAAELAEKQQ